MSLLGQISAMRHIKALLLGAGLIILTNAIVLAGVAYNRSGELDSTITLTERELSLPYYYRGNAENSGIQLQLMHRYDNSGYFRSDYESPEILDWFNKEKLAELGFDVSQAISADQHNRHYQRLREKQVILALEYNGKAYQSVLEAAQQHYDKLLAEQSAEQDNNKKNNNYKLKQAEENLAREKASASRLFVIDAGLDHDTLRTKYADRTKYLLMKGVVMARVASEDASKPRLIGYIKSLSNPYIHVPLQHHAVIEAAATERAHRQPDEPPRLEATINVGQRLEPWLVGVKGLKEE
ncbi:MAG: DUF4824 family protein [Gammaproteobacteria bacterium]|nr:DUF4824 family protein [Gammaproteobacteria bacterium]